MRPVINFLNLLPNCRLFASKPKGKFNRCPFYYGFLTPLQLLVKQKHVRFFFFSALKQVALLDLAHCYAKVICYFLPSLLRPLIG